MGCYHICQPSVEMTLESGSEGGYNFRRADPERFLQISQLRDFLAQLLIGLHKSNAQVHKKNIFHLY